MRKNQSETSILLTSIKVDMIRRATDQAMDTVDFYAEELLKRAEETDDKDMKQKLNFEVNEIYRMCDSIFYNSLQLIDDIITADESWLP